MVDPKKTEALAENDIADAMLWLVKYLPDGALKDFVLDVAEWMENLTKSESFRAQCTGQGLVVPQSFLDGECATKIAGEIRSITTEALMGVTSRLPGLLQMGIACYMGTESPKAQAGFPAIDFTCLLQAAFTYFSTRDIGKTLQAFLACQFGGGGDGGGSGQGFIGTPQERC